MVNLMFHGGVHPHEYKELSESEAIEVLPVPQRVTIPLSQHTGAPATPLVKPGDEVKTGQKIGQSEAFITAYVHSSITGKVVAIENAPHPVAGESKAVIIEGNGIDIPDYSSPNRNWQELKPEEIVAIVKEAGIVGMGGAAFPTHVKLSPPKGKKCETLIINGAECEPFLTSDDRIMNEKTQVMLEGIGILKRAVQANEVLLVVEDNKPKAIKTITQALGKHSEKQITLIPKKTRYPQGSEKQMIYAVTGREVPSGGLPIDVGVVVQNVGTAVAVYEAVMEGKPLFERVVTVTGDAVNKPGNFLTRVGTPYRVLVEFAGGLKETPAKVLSGGPMMGIAQYTLDTPVTKGTSGIVLLTPNMAELPQAEPCIRCSFCIKACPQKLLPQMLAKLAKAEKWHDMKYDFNLMDCMECGCCTYSCPARIPIVQYIKLGKFKTRTLKI